MKGRGKEINRKQATKEEKVRIGLAGKREGRREKRVDGEGGRGGFEEERNIFVLRALKLC